MRCNKKGFTLIELLVVISIIALLLSILVPSLGRAKELARRTLCATNLKGLGVGALVYANKNNDYLPPSYYQTAHQFYGQPSASYMLFRLDLPLSGSMSPKERVIETHNFGHLFMSNIIEDGELFYCPSTPRPVDTTGPFSVSYRYEQYSANGTTFPWNNSYDDSSAWNRDFVRSSYNYVPQAARTKKKVETDSGTGYFPEIAQRASELNSTYVMACDYLFRKDFLPHKKGSGKHVAGVNALFSDGSVKFANNKDAFDEQFWGPASDPYVRIGNDEFLFRSIISLLK